MAFITLAPTWFLGYEVLFILIYAIVSFVLALFALRIFKITSERSVGLFGKGFLLISFAYCFETLFNFLIISELNEGALTISDITVALALKTIGDYGSLVFLLVGLIVILYMTFEKQKPRILAIMILLSLVPLFLVQDPHYLFYNISSICFAFIATHFIENYQKHKNKLSLMTAMAFILLLIGNLRFFFSLTNSLLYVFGHLVVLLAYLIILVNFYLVLKK